MARESIRMNTDKPRWPGVAWNLLMAVTLLTIGWSLGVIYLYACEARRVTPGPNVVVRPPAGPPCPDPIAHTGPYDPRTGAARAGGYKIIPPGASHP
jgi:hypothetical protein